MYYYLFTAAVFGERTGVLKERFLNDMIPLAPNWIFLLCLLIHLYRLVGANQGFVQVPV